MAPHSSTLAGKIPWMEEPGRLQSIELRRVRHDWVTSLSCIGEGNGNPLQCSCLEDPRDGIAWWAAIYGVRQSRTWLKQLSSSSSSRLGRHLELDIKENRRFSWFWPFSFGPWWDIKHSGEWSGRHIIPKSRFESESRSVVSDSLRPHGLYSP